MDPELHCGRLLLPLRKDAFDTHLYDHVAILQQWLNRFTTALIADGFERTHGAQLKSVPQSAGDAFDRVSAIIRSMNVSP